MILHQVMSVGMPLFFDTTTTPKNMAPNYSVIKAIIRGEYHRLYDIRCEDKEMGVIHSHNSGRVTYEHFEVYMKVVKDEGRESLLRVLIDLRAVCFSAYQCAIVSPERLRLYTRCRIDRGYGVSVANEQYLSVALDKMLTWDEDKNGPLSDQDVVVVDEVTSFRRAGKEEIDGYFMCVSMGLIDTAYISVSLAKRLVDAHILPDIPMGDGGSAMVNVAKVYREHRRPRGVHRVHHFDDVNVVCCDEE